MTGRGGQDCSYYPRKAEQDLWGLPLFFSSAPPTSVVKYVSPLQISRVHLRSFHLHYPREVVPRFSVCSMGLPWPWGVAVIPGWSGTHFEASHFPAVEPMLHPLWFSPLSSPQPAWFSGTLGQASDKFPSPGRQLG